MSNAVVLGKRQRARLTSQGQITVPKAVRDALGIRPGDDLEFVPRGTEVVVEVRARRTLLEFAGLDARAASRVPSTVAELDALIEEGMASSAVRRRGTGTRAKPRRE